MAQQLSRYDEACRALAEARAVDDVRMVINKCEAIKEYARRAKNVQLEVDATEVRLRAERRYGELLIDMKANGQITDGRPAKKTVTDNGPFPATPPRVTLVELDTSKNFSSKCQRLAQVPRDKFEHMVRDWRGRALEGEEKIACDFLAQEKAERRAAREAELGGRIMALPNRRYGVIVADPEWRFEPWSRETGMDRSAENHYPTSATEVIAARPVESIAAEDCVLGLWATVPMLCHGILVMGAWGFDYKTHWAWAKDRIGPGYWNRNKHEIFLFGVRGDVPCPAPGEQWDSFLEAPRRGHSEKPDIFLEMMESYFPTLPKIELNRRGPPRAGWDAWGFEARVKEAAVG